MKRHLITQDRCLFESTNTHPSTSCKGLSLAAIESLAMPYDYMRLSRLCSYVISSFLFALNLLLVYAIRLCLSFHLPTAEPSSSSNHRLSVL